MKYFAYIFAFVFIFITSCSKNNDDGDPTNGNGGGATGSLSVGVTSFVGGTTFAQTVSEDGQVSEVINLSETFGMPNGYRPVQSGRNYTIVKDNNETRYHYKYDFSTGTFTTYDNVCGVVPSQALRSAHDNGFVYKSIVIQNPTTQIYREASDGSCEVFTTLNEDIGLIWKILVGTDYVFLVSSPSGQLGDSVFVFNKNDGTLHKRINPGRSTTNWVFNDGNELYLVFADSPEESVAHYSGPDFELVSSAPFTLEWMFGDSSLLYFGDEFTQNNKTIIPHPEESPDPNFIHVPVILNLETGTLESSPDIADMFFTQLQEAHGLNQMIITHYTGDISRNRLVFSFQQFGAATWGVAFANFQGEILSSVLLDYNPDSVTLVD